jgi:sugar phosphate isomerase/epimerase
MHISISTANLYFKPFFQVLELIAEAGFQNIELDLYWERKHLAMAQHLKGIPAKEVVKMIEQAGLRVSSIHEGGGVLEDKVSYDGYISPMLDEVLDALGYAPDCLVFHAPQIEGDPDPDWAKRVQEIILPPLENYRDACRFITIENLPHFDGYYVPIIDPEELMTFVTKNDLYVTLDTTHYAQDGIDLLQAAIALGPRIKTTHLSDYLNGRTHVFIGEGILDLNQYFGVIKLFDLQTITIESSFSTSGKSDQEMSDGELVSRMKEAKQRVEVLLAE